MRRQFCAGWAFVSLATAVCVSCAQDRPRPDPVEPESPASLRVTIDSPLTNQIVLGDRPLLIEVHARDIEADRLTGLGFITRRGGIRVDSVVLRFPATRDSTHVFVYPVPDFETNTQLDIHGLAFGSQGASLEGEPAMVVIVRCQPGFPGC